MKYQGAPGADRALDTRAAMSVTWTDEICVVILGGILHFLDMQPILLRSRFINHTNKFQDSIRLVRQVLVLELVAYPAQVLVAVVLKSLRRPTVE
eukprot:2421276-Pyramimonas_sp.AAC.1